MGSQGAKWPPAVHPPLRLCSNPHGGHSGHMKLPKYSAASLPPVPLTLSLTLRLHYALFFLFQSANLYLPWGYLGGKSSELMLALRNYL